MNPTTRLVDVYVTPAADTGLKLNEYARAEVPIAIPSALIAPRQAVQPKGGGYVVYAIENGHAAEHKVEIGLENENEIQIIDASLQAGTPVVVSGAAQIEDGMAVSVENP